MMIINKIILIIVAFLITGIGLYSQSSIIIGDTVIDRGGSSFIPVKGSLDFNPFDKLEIVLRYDSRILEIKSATGAPGYAIINYKASIDNDFNNLLNATFTIKADSLTPVQDGIICILEVEGLVYMDSIGYILPEILNVNNSNISNFATDTCHIKVRGVPIIQGLKEGVGLNFPNPFNWRTTVKITLENKTLLKFKIFSASGEMVYSSDKLAGDFSIFFIKSDGTGETIENLNKELEPGNYDLVFTPYPWVLSSGAYYLILETNRAVYNTNFIYEK